VVAQIDKPAQSENIKVVSDVKKELADEKKAEDKKPVKKEEVKPTETKKPDVKVTEAIEPVAKPSSTSGDSFTIQVGVFSDIANVKQLQVRLKEVGLDSRTENITTPKGEKIRLRAGRFSSRQEAADALTKLQAADLTGMVISNN
jgi:DedD protein